ncbi:riboflavin biosynthesis protein RibA [Rubrivivax gelatinosus]|nr:riboflavin biosynthesis protein RibA [Rubrivivax gelatinosus]
MSTTHAPLFGERSLTLVAALFPEPAAARRAAESLRTQMAGSDRDVTVVAPGDPDIARKLEPEQAGIWRTMKRSHLVLGAVGFGAGLLLAALLVVFGWPAAVASPQVTTAVCVGFGAVAGMMLAGLLTLRPDHSLVIRQVRHALKHGRSAVVAHPRDEAAASQASAALEAAGGEVVRSV